MHMRHVGITEFFLAQKAGKMMRKFAKRYHEQKAIDNQEAERQKFENTNNISNKQEDEN